MKPFQRADQPRAGRLKEDYVRAHISAPEEPFGAVIGCEESNTVSMNNSVTPARGSSSSKRKATVALTDSGKLQSR